MAATSKFRSDIQGLRAISVLAVVLWHAGLGWLPGGYVGVDVFFVISGFLMTGILVGELDRDGTISLLGFYARRARRLLPAAFTALFGTAVLTFLLLPVTRWAEIGRDIAGCAFYVVNWMLALNSVDYLAQDDAPSPLQHFWSLAVEEQFYIVWPVLLLLVSLLLRRWLRQGVLALTALTFVVSLAISVHETAVNPSVAYFVTPTRIWELALGGFVALGSAYWVRLGRPAALATGWVGLAMVLVSILAYSDTTPFPGWQALLPTVGAALVLVAGPASGARGAVLVLQPAVMQFIGKISYSLYLWHWPLLVVAMARVGDGHSLPLRWGLAVAALSVLPAYLSWRYVEEPVRRSGARLPRPAITRSSLLMGLNCSLAAFVSGSVLSLAAGHEPPSTDPTWTVPVEVLSKATPFGAMALGDAPTTSPAGKVTDAIGTTNPPLEALKADLPAYQPEGCHVGLTATVPGFCEAGDPKGTKLIVLVGDSHAAQWVSALDPIGRQHGWKIGMMTRSSCPFTDNAGLTRAGQPYWQCEAWNAAVKKRLIALHPDLVLTSHAAYKAVGDFAVALDSAISDLEKAGIPVAVIRDVPRPTQSMASCLLDHLGHASACAFSRESGLARSGSGQDALHALRPDLPFIDLTDYICPQPMCAPVIGGVPVYRDGNHLSATYVRSLIPQLARAVEPLVAQGTPAVPKD